MTFERKDQDFHGSQQDHDQAQVCMRMGLMTLDEAKEHVASLPPLLQLALPRPIAFNDQDSNDNTTNNNSWGWFDEMDEDQDHDNNTTTNNKDNNDFNEDDEATTDCCWRLSMSSSCVSTPMSTASSTALTSPCMSKKELVEISNGVNATTCEFVDPMEENLKTFPPLRPNIDPSYSESPIRWFHQLSPKSHVSATISVVAFRIVEDCNSFLTPLTSEAHAEFCIVLELGPWRLCRWKRSSAIDRFVVNSMDKQEFEATCQAWKHISSMCRWFNRLEIDYLRRKCMLLHEFLQVFLYECSTAHPLAMLLEC